jgi:hypothetical protein
MAMAEISAGNKKGACGALFLFYADQKKDQGFGVPGLFQFEGLLGQNGRCNKSFSTLLTRVDAQKQQLF